MVKYPKGIKYMSNYVRSKLNIHGDSTEIKRYIERFTTEEITDDIATNGFDFRKIIPIPSYIYEGNLGQEELKIYGEENCWYNWCRKNWRTKWNAFETKIMNDGDECCIYFQTAWSGVPKLIGLSSQMFPNLQFDYQYADEDAGSNVAHYKFSNGHVEENESIRSCTHRAYQIYLECWDYELSDCSELDIDSENKIYRKDIE